MALWNKDKRDPAANGELKVRTLRTAPRARRDLPEGLAGVKNIIAVGSGKGGVGKSTVAVNLAVALRALGAKVGLLDADIYGPSQPGMLGAGAEKANLQTDVLKPLERHGVSFMSIGLLMDNDGPVVWRAPMAVKMIQQFIGSVAWGELDYLLIDMPPGTGDVQLTLAQQAPLTGCLIVTTPQDVALGIARKGLKMFQQVNVPVLGVVENMSGFHCRKCGEPNLIFKAGGGEKMAKEAGVPLLGSIPLDPDVVASGDDGVPVVAKSKDSVVARAFLAAAARFEDEVEKGNLGVNSVEPEKLEKGPNGELFIRWPDGHQARHTPYHLRINCACAACVNEDTGRRTLDPKRVPLDIKIQALHPVGRYGLGLMFSDGHDTGIYTFERLRKELCECPDCLAKREQTPQSFSV